MDSCVLLAFLLLCWAGAASAGPALKAPRVGDAVTLPATLPQGSPSTNILLRATSRGEGVAIWEPSGGGIFVIGQHYNGRVAFQQDQMAFTIANLSLGDGGIYQVSLGTSPEKLLNSFQVAVFNVTSRVSSQQNDSCQVDLECQAGMGPNERVTYAWKDAGASTTLGQGPRITQRMSLNQEKDYICLAQARDQAQSTFRIALKNPCVPDAAAPGPWALGSLLAGGFLVPAVLLLLL